MAKTKKATKKPATKPAAKVATTKRATKNATTRPAAKQPAAKQPAAKQPAAKQPAATQLAAKNEPAKNEPAKAGANKPVVKAAATEPTATKPTATKPTATKPTATEPATLAGPSLFRLNVEVRDLDRAEHLYNTLLGTTGRRQAGSRLYYTCGAVTIQMVDISATGEFPHPVPKALYFLVDDLDAVHVRARELGVLSVDDVHGQVGGEIAVRPWGERSFYVDDPWQNALCFVQTGTTYPG